ncbi:MAG TPA: tyrosine-protein phosphatase, partial [Candidatus Binatia bacterium]|nr:tyrosine-protein phosphatase [Candidatus Binatia bacterium]
MQDRLMPFERILNFRDFGGWETADGAKIARGKLYRSASFHDATDADIDKLNAMDVRFLVDLRRAEERAHEPSRWLSESCRVIFNDDGAGPGTALPPHLVALLQSDLSPKATREYMTSLYREIPYDPRLVRLYRDWFAELGEGGAGIIHCAAGKDRTGIGCALTLLALGVDEESVFADYEFTNQAVDLERRMPRIQQRMEERLARKLDPEALRPMLGV